MLQLQNECSKTKCDDAHDIGALLVNALTSYISTSSEPKLEVLTNSSYTV